MKLKDSQLTSEIKKLHYQLSFSHELNKKLAEELRQYQMKFGVQSKKFKKDPQELVLVNLNNYIQQLFYIEPLIIAYEEKMERLQYMIKDLQQDSNITETKIYQIISENDFLRTELQNKCKFLLEKESIGLNVKYLKLENENYKQKQQIIKQENHLLKVQIEKLKNQLEVIKKQRKRDTEIQQLNRRIDKLKQQNRQSQMNHLQKVKQLDLLKTNYKNQKILFNELQNKNYEIENLYAKLINEHKLLKNQYENLKQLHEQTIDNLKDQIDNLKSQLKNTQRHENQLFNKNLALQADLQNKNNLFHNTQLKIVSTETNNNNLLQMLESYENKVAHQTKKIKKLQDQLKEINQKLKNLAKEKDLLVWKLEQKQKQIQRLYVQVRNEKDRVSKNYQQRFQSLKRNNEGEKNQLQDQISNLKSNLISLELKVQKLHKQNQSLKAENVKLLS